MQKNINLLNQIKESANIDSSEILGVQTVEKIKNQKAEERVMIVTLFNFFLFTKKPIVKRYTLSRQYRWDLLKEISLKNINNNKIIHFVFQEESIQIQAPNLEDILKTVISTIFRILPNFELPKLAIPKSILDTIKKKKDAILDRFKFRVYATDKQLNENMYKEFASFANKVLSRPGISQTLDLNIFKTHFQYTDCVLDSICFTPKVQRIIVPLFPQHTYWPFLSKFVAHNRTVTSLEIQDPYNPALFKEFVEGISHNKFSHISRISLYNGSFDSTFVVQLAIILEAHPFSQIGLFKGLTQDGFQVLLPMLSTVKGFQSLTSISLTGSRYLNISSIVHSLKKIKSFCFNDCELDVSSVLSIFAQNPDSMAKEISLSNNICSTSITDELNFPPKITTLNLDGVKWSGNSIISVFKFISRRSTVVTSNVNFTNPNSTNSQMPTLTLNISKANMTPKQWNKFDAFLRSYELNFINQFYFDQNPVGSGFLSFMNSNPSLQTISLCGCFSNGDPMIDSFADTIAENVSVTKLLIRGIGVNILADSVSTVLAGVCRNKHIQNIDISGNATGNDLIRELQKTLMDNYTLTHVSMDNNNLNDVNALRNMLTELIKVKRSVHINVPKKDLAEMSPSQSSLKKDGKIDKNIVELTKLFSILDEQANAEDSLPVSATEMDTIRTGEFNYPLTESEEKETIHYVLDERINEEYVSDLQWESMLDTVPELNFEELGTELLQQYTLDALISEIYANGNEP